MRMQGGRLPEAGVFALALAALLGAFFAESLFGGTVLSPADVLKASASFRPDGVLDYEPRNRLLMDPVVQFQPWLAFNREMIRKGRLPVWNSFAGCGAPHLANGQSGVFDPFHAIAYLGTLPEALAWMAWARLWVAGMGMFLLARSWGFGRWGRWFCGLVFPLCGFLVVWLLFPVTSVAVWLPWLFLATDRLLERRNGVNAARVAVVVGLVLLGGHIQTSAHILLAAGLYSGWRLWHALISSRGWPGRPRVRAAQPQEGSGAASAHSRSDSFPIPSCRCATRTQGRPGHPGSQPRGLLFSRACLCWLAAVCWGIALGAIVVVPLAFYLAKSPVWTDRQKETPSAWTLTRPRVLDAICTVFPYAFGSQRRGQPNLARALGVHNLNESAGGFAGVATALWLAPLGFWMRRRDSRVQFLAMLAVAGFLGAFGWPPVVNLLRALPVLDVADNRRLTLWTAFGLVLLGGIGLDHLAETGRLRGWRTWATCWLIGAGAMVISAALIGSGQGWLKNKAYAHYARAAAETPGADPIAYRQRAERQVAQTVAFLPRYLLLCAGELSALAFLVILLRQRALRPSEDWRPSYPPSAWERALRPLRGHFGAETQSARRPRSHAERRNEGLAIVRGAVMFLTMVELLAFGFGLNPAITRAEHEVTGPVIEYLHREIGDQGRILGIGAELIPNTLMRSGLADVRNYDSIELTRSLDWFAPLYEHTSRARTSRRTVTWTGVLRAQERLRSAGVQAIVSASAPPAGSFARVDRVGNVWIARIAAEPLVRLASGRPIQKFTVDHGCITVRTDLSTPERLCVAQTFDRAWQANVDGKRVAIQADRGAFLAIDLTPGPHQIRLEYRPSEVAWALAVSLVALGAAIGTWMMALLFRAKSAWTRWRTRVTIDSRDLHRTSQPAYH